MPVGAVQCQCAQMNGLRRLIDRLLTRQQHRDFVFQLNRLRGFHVAQRRVGREAHRKTARQSFGETEIRRDGCPAVELSSKQQLGSVIGIKQFNPYRSPLDHKARLAGAGTGDDYPHGCGRSSDIRSLPQNAQHGPFENLRQRAYLVEIGGRLVFIAQRKTHALPHQFIQRHLLAENHPRVPDRASFGYALMALHFANHVILGGQQLQFQLRLAAVRGFVGRGKSKSIAKIVGGDCSRLHVAKGRRN